MYVPFLEICCQSIDCTAQLIISKKKKKHLKKSALGQGFLKRHFDLNQDLAHIDIEHVRLWKIGQTFKLSRRLQYEWLNEEGPFN